VPLAARPPLLWCVVLGVAAAGCSSDSTTTPSQEPPPPDSYTFTKQDSFPHNDSLFTEGLFYHGGFLYEGTGLATQSTLRQMDLAGNTLLRVNVEGAFIGEGIAHDGTRVVQLTLSDGRAFRYQLSDFAKVDTLRFGTNGWGVTFDGTQYIVSTGKDSLYFRSAADFSEIRRVWVNDRGRPINKLNELEYIGGEVWANVWQTDSIAIITPSDGRVRAWLDCTGLAEPGDINPFDAAENVLNGIAYDATGDRILLTGKRWREIFHITLASP
jgi:glutamine cyclotransferase